MRDSLGFQTYIKIKTYLLLYLLMPQGHQLSFEKKVGKDSLRGLSP